MPAIDALAESAYIQPTMLADPVRRTILGWVAIAGIVACSPIPHSAAPADVITPAAASTMVRQLFDQRVHAIESGDISMLQTIDGPNLLSIDVGLAKELQGQAIARQHGQELSVPPPSGPITGVDVFVPHQTGYPAVFVALARFSGGDGAVIGFERPYNKPNWLVWTYSDVSSPTDLHFAKGSDGYAPEPAWTPYAYESDIPGWVAYYEASKCRSTTGCSTDNPPNPPTGYSAGVVGGKAVDDHVASVAQVQAATRSSNLSVSWRVGATWPSFPWFKVASGGLLGFITEQSQVTTTTGGPSHGCFQIDYQGEYLNAEMPAGKFYSNIEVDISLMTATGPPNSGTPSFTILGGTGAVTSDLPQGQGC